MISENITKFTCDICKNIQYLENDDLHLIHKYRFPASIRNVFGEPVTGIYDMNVDLCENCANELESYLNKYYDMHLNATNKFFIKKKVNQT